MTNKKLLAGILGILLVFTFVLTGCDNGGGGGDPEPGLAQWAGTWNSIDQYLDDQALNQVWTDAVTAITTAEPSAVVDAATLRGLFANMVRVDFKSCVIEGDTMKVYNSPNATGSLSETISYTYKGTVGENAWSAFEGNKAGQYKYLVLGPTHQDAPGAMVHFHLQYSATSFDAATENTEWAGTVTPSNTTLTQIAQELTAFPWAEFAFMFVPNP